jgi:hypothetical protein
MEPPDFDCRDAMQVLRLRLRDWLWPAAVAIAVAIWILAQSKGTYRIGSVTYYANTYGPPLFLAAILFAGLRWCSIGRLRPRDPSRCGQCDYPLDWLAPSRGPQCCPECGADASGPPRKRRIPLSRMLLDLPGLLALLFPIFVVAMLLLAMLGVIELE